MTTGPWATSTPARRCGRNGPRWSTPATRRGVHPLETGERGVYLAEVDDYGAVSLDFRPVDAARWETLSLDISGLKDEQDLLDAVNDLSDSTLAAAGGRPVIARLALTGRGPLHASLRRPDTASAVLDNLNGRHASAQQWLWCERIQADTASPVDREQAALREDFAGDLARLGGELRDDPSALSELRDTLRTLYVNSNAAPYLRGYLPSDGEFAGTAGRRRRRMPGRAGERRGRRVRIEELYLEGFGHFHQRSIGPLSGPVTVFYGPNEAGKSTTLAFIRGRPVRLSGPVQQPLPAAGRRAARRAHHGVGQRRGGLRRGAVRRSAGRAEHRCRQRPGVQRRCVVAAAHRQRHPRPLPQRVRLPASTNCKRRRRSTIPAVFIYSAGQGAPGLPALRKSLSDHKGQIYLSRGNNQEVPRLLSTLREVDAQLRTIEGNAGRYAYLAARKSEIDAKLLDADARACRPVGPTRRGLTVCSAAGMTGWGCPAANRSWRDMPRYVDFPEKPHWAFGEPGGSDTAVAARTGTRPPGSYGGMEEAAAAEIPGEDLLYDRERVEVIRRARSSFDNSVKDLPERQAELRGMETDFAETLSDLGHQWGESELESFDTSLVVRNRVDLWKQEIADGQERARQAQFQLAQEQRTLQDHQAETQDARG